MLFFLQDFRLLWWWLQVLFSDITLCHPVNKQFGGTYHLHLQRWRVTKSKKQAWSREQAKLCFILVYCLAYSSTQNTKLRHSSETSGDFHWTTRHYIPEDNSNSCYFHFINRQMLTAPWGGPALTRQPIITSCLFKMRTHLWPDYTVEKPLFF
jgi:hypothetical protein